MKESNHKQNIYNPVDHGGGNLVCGSFCSKNQTLYTHLTPSIIYKGLDSYTEMMSYDHKNILWLLAARK